MGLDIRLPIGLFFSLLGAILSGYGLFSDPALYQRSLGYNVNLYWGLVVLAFGLLMLWLGRKGGSSAHPALEEPEGRAIEARELAEGLESENPLDRE